MLPQFGILPVPMYDTFDDETIRGIIELTELRVVICSEAEKKKVIAAAKGTTVQVVAVFAVGGGGGMEEDVRVMTAREEERMFGSGLDCRRDGGVRVVNFASILNVGRAHGLE